MAHKKKDFTLCIRWAELVTRATKEEEEDEKFHQGHINWSYSKGTMDSMENSEQKKDFICWTCKVKFVDLAIFRNHFRSEWHRHNMHTTSNGFPPITLEEFQKKEAIFKEKQNAVRVETKQFCEICRKKFSSWKQCDNHLASKTHKKMLELKNANNYIISILHNFKS